MSKVEKPKRTVVLPDKKLTPFQKAELALKEANKSYQNRLKQAVMLRNRIARNEEKNRKTAADIKADKLLDKKMPSLLKKDKALVDKCTLLYLKTRK